MMLSKTERTNFNPRSREGSDHYLYKLNKRYNDFNPRSREGSDVFIAVLMVSMSISIHAPARGATVALNAGDNVYINFNPRSREGSDVFCCKPNNFNIHFNPRSREGSDDVSKLIILSINISIHAPARGATESAFHQGDLKNLFQSTLPRGERLIELQLHQMHLFISIHAPARGATKDAKSAVDDFKFQSTLPRGERLLAKRNLGKLITFQSTLPRGERHQ